VGVKKTNITKIKLKNMEKSNENEEKLLKQTYLREAILEAGYDPNKFVLYLDNERKDGSNIDNWTLDELKLQVQTYKRYYSVEESPEKKQNDISENIDTSPEKSYIVSPEPAPAPINKSLEMPPKPSDNSVFVFNPNIENKPDLTIPSPKKSKEKPLNMPNSPTNRTQRFVITKKAIPSLSPNIQSTIIEYFFIKIAKK